MIDNGHSDVDVGEEIGGKVFLEPFVLVNVLSRGPPHRVSLEHVAKQAHDALVQVLGDRENSGCNEYKMAHKD